ncbi:MAG: branched-chain amino acid aminotransferase [Paracoccaceae bacterium]|nr:branched-chain amino acid aminotransferase [Paracoccaceae bacterium]
MATGNNIRTYYNGQWSDEDVAIMRAGDHGSWLGSTVFDGARYFDGVIPDLWSHCDRVNQSANAMMITPTVPADEMVAIVWEGLKLFPSNSAVYIRPMYWALDGGDLAIIPKENSTGFAICMEDIPMADQASSATLTTTSFRRPVLEDNVVNAKAGCLYPNNARMLAEARKKGFSNALVCDVMGNVAETATANIFLVKDGEVFTPIPNGTFLAGITRDRHILNLQNNGFNVIESVLSLSDFLVADEVFMSGNMMKVTAVSAFQDTCYQLGPITRQVREMYWEWALSEKK